MFVVAKRRWWLVVVVWNQRSWRVRVSSCCATVVVLVLVFVVADADAAGAVMFSVLSGVVVAVAVAVAVVAMAGARRVASAAGRGFPMTAVGGKGRRTNRNVRTRGAHPTPFHAFVRSEIDTGTGRDYRGASLCVVGLTTAGDVFTVMAVVAGTIVGWWWCVGATAAAAVVFEVVFDFDVVFEV